MISPDQLKKSACMLLPGLDHDVERLVSDGWEIVDFDAFLENLSLWGDPTRPTELLFSDPLPGIRQFLANVSKHRVGLFGEGLRDDGLRNQIVERYVGLGYCVLVQSKEQQFFPARHSTNPRIMFD